MKCNIEATKLEILNKTRKNVTATIDGYITIDNLELGNCNKEYEFKDNVNIIVNSHNTVINNYYENDNVFTLNLNECIINDSIYCNIVIDGVWLKSNLKNQYIEFETIANAHANIENIE